MPDGIGGAIFGRGTAGAGRSTPDATLRAGRSTPEGIGAAIFARGTAGAGRSTPKSGTAGGAKGAKDSRSAEESGAPLSAPGMPTPTMVRFAGGGRDGARGGATAPGAPTPMAVSLGARTGRGGAAAALPSAETWKEVPHLGHLIFTPAAGIRRSSSSYGARQDGHSTLIIGGKAIPQKVDARMGVASLPRRRTWVQ